MSKPNVIVCAATFSTRGHLVVGARHGDPRMVELADALNDTLHDNQGFIDRFGKFHSRTEAWKIAEAAGQIKYRCGGDTKDGGTLYSENLY